MLHATRHRRPQLPARRDVEAALEGVRWIRLLYCYPSYFSDELVVHMLGFLPTHAVGSAARTCSRLRDLCREPLVYISVDVRPQAARYQGL